MTVLSNEQITESKMIDIDSLETANRVLRHLYETIDHLQGEIADLRKERQMFYDKAIEHQAQLNEAIAVIGMRVEDLYFLLDREPLIKEDILSAKRTIQDLIDFLAKHTKEAE